MQVTPGTRLGPYEIVAPIGAGGMGEVWRARDTRIGRDVAVKILPAAFAADGDRLRRFEQEARVAGSLNHPNLVTIHDFGTDNGAPYVVMELLEGETLRDKIVLAGAPVRVPLRKAIDYSVQIASGLAAAHDKGIVHRDLKPENIFLTKDGRAKILDFGLAKLTAPAGEGLTEARTQHRDTSPGTVVGTAGYMSPEQVRGQQVDHRSDIFSFGAILYEMLSGKSAFKRDSSVETMSAILKEEPPELSESGVNVPAIDMVVRHCLEKSAEERFQSARDLAFDLQRISSASGSSPAIAVPRAGVRWVAPAAAILIAVAAVVISWRQSVRASASLKTPPPTRTFALLTNRAGVEQFPSLAPDGKTFVYVSGASGKSDIYLKRVDGWNAINLTKDSAVDDTQPAFSPDGSQIAFRSERDGGGIFLMGATGESVRRLTDFGFNPTWSPDASEIAVSTESIELQPQSRPGGAHIAIINVRTGAQRDLTMPDGVQPSWSPHGDRIAYWALKGSSGQRDLYTIDPHAAHPEATIIPVMDDPPLDWNPIWSPDGKFLYFGSDRDGTMNLWRLAIDEHSGKADGRPEAMSLPTRFAAHFTVARDTGAVAYAAIDLSETLWRVPFDPQSLRVTGHASAILGGAMRIFTIVDVSPDGKWLAFSNVGLQQDLFVMKSDGSEMRQLTNDPEKDIAPSWSPDGKLLYFHSQRGPRYEVWSIRPDGSGLRRVSRTTGPSLLTVKVTPDGKALYGVLSGGGAAFMPLDADGTATKYQPLPPLPDSRSRFAFPRLSPDGSRVVGGTGRSGFSTGTEKRGVWLYSIAQRSYEKLADDGGNPQWLGDGKHVLFVSGTELKVVDIASRQSHTIPLPRPIVGFTLAPDGHALYLNERDTEGDIWMMSTH